MSITEEQLEQEETIGNRSVDIYIEGIGIKLKC